MTYPLSPAHQHTRCVLALTLAHATMEVLTPALASSPLKGNAARVNRWLTACQASLPKRKLSAGALRDMEVAICKLAPHATTGDRDGDARLTQWVANLRAAHSLVLDCTITCKDITAKQHWRWLESTMLTLCHKLEAMCPDAEEAGTQIYMEVA